MDRTEAYNKSRRRGCIIGTPIGLAISLSMIIMGALHLDKCPAERFIPIYLVVSGSFSIVALMIGAFLHCKKQDNPNRRTTAVWAVSVFISLFLLAWFIAGNVWIFRLKNKYSPDAADHNYCDNTFYLYAFWIIIVMHILTGISILVRCYMCLMACYAGR